MSSRSGAAVVAVLAAGLALSLVPASAETKACLATGAVQVSGVTGATPVCSLTVDCSARNEGPCGVSARVEVAAVGIAGGRISTDDGATESCTAPGGCTASLTGSIEPGTSQRITCAWAGLAGAYIEVRCYAEPS